MKKIGIVSLYYNSVNYGGLAQAYALNRYFMDLGYESELISYDRIKKRRSIPEKRKNITSMPLGVIVEKCYRKTAEKLGQKFYESRLDARKARMKEFRDAIPHSARYTEDTISQCENKYDVFVSGSDQIWKPGVVDAGFTFDFLKAPEKKTVLSYSSSVSVKELPDDYIHFMSGALKKYSAISLREATTAKQFRTAFNRDVQVTVDPVLLVDESIWTKMAGEKLLDEKYVFCYMLGDNIEQRRDIKKYAKSKKLKLVTLPHIKQSSRFEVRVEDIAFGDKQMFEVGMPEFLSLIKYADVVVTDSFHAGVFSYIFRKEFYLFERPTRNPNDVMNVRIYDLLSLYGVPDRLVKVGDGILDKSSEKIDFLNVEKNISAARQYSRKYLQEALGENGR
jgi:hypothetical protein